MQDNGFLLVKLTDMFEPPDRFADNRLLTVMLLVNVLDPASIAPVLVRWPTLINIVEAPLMLVASGFFVVMLPNNDELPDIPADGNFLVVAGAVSVLLPDMLALKNTIFFGVTLILDEPCKFALIGLVVFNETSIVLLPVNVACSRTFSMMFAVNELEPARIADKFRKATLVVAHCKLLVADIDALSLTIFFGVVVNVLDPASIADNGLNETTRAPKLELADRFAPMNFRLATGADKLELAAMFTTTNFLFATGAVSVLVPAKIAEMFFLRAMLTNKVELPDIAVLMP